MIRLASLYADGLGVERDTDKARELLEQAASYDDTDAMVRLAKGYRDGIFGEVDRAQARVWLEKAVLLDSEDARDLLADDRPGEAPGDACDRLASLEKDPLHAPGIANFGYVNPKRAIPVCEAAVKALPKVLRYQNQLGQAYLEAERYGDAFKIFNAAAAKGSVFATGWMGTLYDRGWGVGKDVKLANDWHRKAVATGSASAMYNLGQSLLNGTGIAKDVPAARKLFDQAAAKGSTAAMMQLGTLFDNGEGVAKDATLAREWYQKAVDGGETSAEFSLALLYLDGTGVEKNETEARRRFGIAAAGGSTASMRKLANLYLHGIGGEVELQKARGLLEQAANKDDTRAMNLLAQALLAGVFKDVDLEEGRPGGADEALAWYRKSAAAGNEAAISWMANFAPGAKGNAAMGDDCDRAAGAAEDDRHSVNIPTTTRVDAKLGVPACEAAVAAAPGNLRYANQLARVYLTAGRDYDAVRVFKDAARRGSNFAMLWVGNAYDRKLAGLERNPGETALWYEKAAANGSRTAMFNLGVLNINLYNDDIEPQKNAVAAAQWFGKAAELGNPDALRQMAVMYREGIGVAQDKARYHDLLAKAANLGDAGALRDMARNAASGDGMAKNMTLAVEYATKAADAGDVDVLTDLAALLYRAGGPDNLARSRATLEKGVARQDIRAIVNLAVLLRDGRFGKAEPAEARRLQKLAADLDPKKAKAELDRLEN